MKIQTVNVIELAWGNILGIQSFSDDEPGNEEADDIFAVLVREHSESPVADDIMNKFLDDGYYEEGTYALLIRHSH
jgi:hypothetical protein